MKQKTPQKSHFLPQSPGDCDCQSSLLPADHSSDHGITVQGARMLSTTSWALGDVQLKDSDKRNPVHCVRSIVC